MISETELPLDAGELAELSADALAFIAQIREITDADSDGGKKITRAERRELLKAAAGLVGQLAVDIVD